ncbi:unnamed protein product, partial [Rotaria magnacalcarata]
SELCNTVVKQLESDIEQIELICVDDVDDLV